MPTSTPPDHFLPLNPSDLQLLLVLLLGAQHAYGIAKAVEEQDRGGISLEIGSLYRMLARLEDWGLIRRAGFATTSDGPRRKLYAITSLGKKVTLLETQRLREVVVVAEERLRRATT